MKIKKIFNIFKGNWCIVCVSRDTFVKVLDKKSGAETFAKWRNINMKKSRFMTAACICMAMIMSACAPSGTQQPDNQEYTDEETIVEAKEYQRKLDIIEPAAYRNVEGPRGNRGAAGGVFRGPSLPARCHSRAQVLRGAPRDRAGQLLRRSRE